MGNLWTICFSPVQSDNICPKNELKKNLSRYGTVSCQGQSFGRFKMGVRPHLQATDIIDMLLEISPEG